MTGERATPGVCHRQKLSHSPSGNIAIKYWHIKGVEIGLLRKGSCVCVCVCVCVLVAQSCPTLCDPIQ